MADTFIDRWITAPPSEVGEKPPFPWQKFLLPVIGGAGFLTFAILLIKYIKEKKR